jgi:hypothetical protein
MIPQQILGNCSPLNMSRTRRVLIGLRTRTVGSPTSSTRPMIAADAPSP